MFYIYVLNMGADLLQNVGVRIRISQIKLSAVSDLTLRQ